MLQTKVHKMSNFTRLLLNLRNNPIHKMECKRFKGHSKWANIRHTKMAKDSEKANSLQNVIKKMRFAIAEHKSPYPEDNPKLARIIELAKKDSLPLQSIKSFLEKMQKSKTGVQSALLESRGPSGCVILIQLLTGNITQSKQSINTHLRKCKFSQAELPTRSLYQEKGIIVTKTNNKEIDKVTDDAIEAGAEDVEQVLENNNEFLQFTCGHIELLNVRNKLEDLNYKIIQAEVEYIPELFVELNDNEMELVSNLYTRLGNFEEVIKIYSNIL